MKSPIVNKTITELQTRVDNLESLGKRTKELKELKKYIKAQNRTRALLGM